MRCGLCASSRRYRDGTCYVLTLIAKKEGFPQSREKANNEGGPLTTERTGSWQSLWHKRRHSFRHKRAHEARPACVFG